MCWLRWLACGSRGTEGARSERGGGTACGLHERRRLQLPPVVLCEQRDDRAFCGHGGRAHGHRGRFAGSGEEARRLYGRRLCGRRRHGRYRHPGAFGRDRSQRRRPLYLLRQRGVHEHGHPEELAYPLRRQDHNDARREELPRMPHAEEERVRDYRSSRASLCRNGERRVYERLPEKARAREGYPRYAVHPRDRAVPDGVGCSRVEDGRSRSRCGR